MRVFGGAVLASGAPGNRGQPGLLRERGLRCGFPMCHRGVDQQYWTVFYTDQQTELGAGGSASCRRRLSQRTPVPSSASLLKPVEQVVVGKTDHYHR